MCVCVVVDYCLSMFVFAAIAVSLACLYVVGIYHVSFMYLLCLYVCIYVLDYVNVSVSVFFVFITLEEKFVPRVCSCS